MLAGKYNSIRDAIQAQTQENLSPEVDQLRQRTTYLENELVAARLMLEAETGELAKLPRNAMLIGDDMLASPWGHLDGAMNYIVHSPVISPKQKGDPIKPGEAASVYEFEPLQYPLWIVPGSKSGYIILNTTVPERSESYMMPSMPGMMGGGMGGFVQYGVGISPRYNRMGIHKPTEIVNFTLFQPDPQEHTLTLDGEFPASDLAENVICARQFPFEEYKLGMIQAVVPETVAGGETFSLRLGVGNLDARNAKLLLTVEYDDGLQQNDIPSGATLFLGFIGSHEYREYKTEFTLHADGSPTDGKHNIRLILRNESGQIIAECKVTVMSG